MIEVEIKVELATHVLEKIQELFDFLPSVQFLNQTYQVDSYYDTQQYACFRQAVFLRVRNQAALEIKYHDAADPLHTHCIERVFPLDAEPCELEEMNELGARFVTGWRKAETVEEALACNGLIELICIEKQRRHYRYRDALLCIDTIPGLGHFLELEISCKEDRDVVLAYGRLQEVLAHFALSSLSVVRQGYVELWLRRYRPHIYQLVGYPQDGAQDVETGGQRLATAHQLQGGYAKKPEQSGEFSAEK